MSLGTESSPKGIPDPPDGFELVEDGWLGDRFGHPVFTVRITGGSPDVPKLFEQIERDGPARATYQARIDAADATLSNDLQGRFETVGTTVTLERPLGRDDLPNPVIRTRDAVARDRRVVADIASRSLNGTRFHTDPVISNEVARAVKRVWAENLVSGDRGDGVWVAESGSTVIGFLGWLLADECAVIDLIAVDQGARLTGVGTSLVQRFLEAAQKFGAKNARVGTQIANPGALAFYERLGFRTVRAEHDLHWHVGSAGSATR